MALETYRTIHLIFVELEKIRIPLYREDQFLIHGLNVQHDIHSTVLSGEKTSVYGLVYFLNCRSVHSLLIQIQMIV